MGLATQSREHFHYRGRFVIRTEWRGKTLLYDVSTKSGQPVALGLDMLSRDEETAMQGIVSRLGGNVNER